jgi:hypothetical protein
LAAGTALGAALAACSLIGTTGVKQCETPDDCKTSPLAANPDITVLCQNGLCVEGPAPVDAGTPCTKNSECAGQSTPSTCGAGNLCVAIEDPEVCPDLLPPRTTYHQDDNAVIVGVYMFDPKGSRGRAAVQLAAEQLATKQTRPRIIPLLCSKNVSKTSNRAKAVIEHLRRLRAPLVIGEFEQSDFTDLLGTAKGTAAEGHRVAMWSTLTSHGSVREPALPSDGLYRFLVDDMSSTRVAFQSVIDRAVARAKLLDATLVSPILHRFLVSKTPEAEALASALEADNVQVDGVPIGGGGARIQVLPSYENPNEKYDNLAAEIRAPNPRVIVAIGAREIMNPLVSNIDKLGGSSPAVYVVGTRAKLETGVMQDLTDRIPTFRRRFFGVDFAGDSTALDKFYADVDDVGGQPFTRSYDMLYDAMHVVALAAAAADRSRDPGTAGPKLTAGDLAFGLGALADPSQPRVNVTNYGGAGLETLRNTGRVSFEGTTGVWRFDDAGSRIDMGASMYCFGTTGASLIYYQDPSFDAGPSDAACAP